MNPSYIAVNNTPLLSLSLSLSHIIIIKYNNIIGGSTQ